VKFLGKYPNVMSLQFGVNIHVQLCARHAHVIALTIEQANRSVSLLGFDNQAASTTCQAAWLQNTSLAFGENCSEICRATHILSAAKM